jgi:hypothetical protein
MSEKEMTITQKEMEIARRKRPKTFRRNTFLFTGLLSAFHITRVK